jgi:ribose transport system ATP-binding protein
MLLEARNVCKTYGHTSALTDGSLSVADGEIHGLLGQNGAGKSTLVKILAGVVHRESGEIEVAGESLPVNVHPKDVRALGMSFIHQDLGLIEQMTVAENIALGLGFLSRAGVVSDARLRKQAEHHLHELGVDVNPSAELGSLNGADQALVAIARAVVYGARLVVLDEPTARLRGPEVDRLFTQLDVLRKRGVGFVYVTHRLEEVFTLTDRVTVLRNGVTVATRVTSELTENELISEIVGTTWEASEGPVHDRSTDASRREPVVEVSDLVTELVDGASVEIHAGEVVGVTGPAGAGSSIARAIAGVTPPESGTIKVLGESPPSSPREAIGREIAYIPADRHLEGLAVEMTVGENLACGAYTQTEKPKAMALRRWARIASPRREGRAAAELIDRFGIRAPGPDTLVSLLSGGNQQKVLLAKWLQRSPRLLILDEPTQGVDVGTRREIYEMVEKLAQSGVPLIVISADFQELAELCDRVIVIRGRRVGTVLTGDKVTQESIAAESYRAAATVGAVSDNRAAEESS